MTELEKHALRRLIKNAEVVTVGSITYEEQEGGGLKRVEEIPMDEVNRRFDSADYKLGWQKCYEYMSGIMALIMDADKASLIKYAGRPKKK